MGCAVTVMGVMYMGCAVTVMGVMYMGCAVTVMGVMYMGCAVTVMEVMYMGCSNLRGVCCHLPKYNKISLRQSSDTNKLQT